MTGEAPERAFPGAEPSDVLRGYYAQMALIRAFELRAAEMYQRAKIGGYCHLNLGEEATVVGLMAALEDRDYLFTTYREHGYALARGARRTTGVVRSPRRQTRVTESAIAATRRVTVRDRESRLVSRRRDARDPSLCARPLAMLKISDSPR